MSAHYPEGASSSTSSRNHPRANITSKAVLRGLDRLTGGDEVVVSVDPARRDAPALSSLGREVRPIAPVPPDVVINHVEEHVDVLANADTANA